MCARQRFRCAMHGSAIATTLACSAFAQGPSGAPRAAASNLSVPGAGNVAAITRSLGANLPVPASRYETLDLEVDEQRVIPSENVQSYSEGAKGIIDVRLTKDASQFIVVGLRPGPRRCYS